MPSVRQSKRPYLAAFILFLLLALLVVGQKRPAPLHAQTNLTPDQPAPYWQYAASARLSHVHLLDTNNDTVAEILVVDESNRVSLISASAERRWSYDAPDTITALGVVHRNQAGRPATAVVLGAPNRLIMLADDGTELWQQTLTAVDPSPAFLAASGQAAAEAWQSAYDALPAAILPLRPAADAAENVLVVLHSGQMQLFDGDGRLLWRYTRNTNPSLDAAPQVIVTDLNGDGADEILLGGFNPRRFSQLALLDATGRLTWEQSISARLTALTTLTFDGEPAIAVGTSRGEILLYNGDRQRLWLRTLNKAITDLVSVELAHGPALIAGTEVGTLVAYSTAEGRRLWTRTLAPEANLSALNLTTATPLPGSGRAPETRPFLSVVLANPALDNSPADVVLLNRDGHTLARYPAIDTAGLTELVDVNNDGQNELLLARFATIELLGLAGGSSKMAQEWNYASLFASPSTVLVLDLDQDGNDEIVIGARDGRLHRLDHDGSPRWIVEPGGVIVHVDAIIPAASSPLIVVVHNDSQPGLNSQERVEGVVELRQTNGDKIWQRLLPAEVTAVLIAPLESHSLPNIIVGAADGRVLVFDVAGELLWSSLIEGPVNQLVVRDNPTLKRPELLAISRNLIYRLLPQGTASVIAASPHAITQVYTSRVGERGGDALLYTLGAGNLVDGFNWRGVKLPQWPVSLNGRPLASLQMAQTPPTIETGETANETNKDVFLIATDAGELLQLYVDNDKPLITWQLSNLPNVSSLYWGDLDGDAVPEVVVGDRTGNLFLFATGRSEPQTRLDVLSGVHTLAAVRSTTTDSNDLLVVTENGLVQLFRAKENHPPLLTEPRVDLMPDVYHFSVAVQDVEQDEVSVWLELFDASQSNWQRVEERRVIGQGVVNWTAVAPPTAGAATAYRFVYSDGYHTGVLSPPPAPGITAVPPPQFPPQLPILFLSLVGLGVALYTLRQSRTPSARARRFYRQLRRNPTQSLLRLEGRYAYTRSSGEFLLNLGNQARQHNDWLISSLVDGLFLLPNQPQAGLALIVHTLKSIGQKSPPWHGSRRWEAVFKSGQVLLDAPTITELSLAQPQLNELLALLETEGVWSPVLEALLPILSALRDSQRVERSDDRLVYLNEANLLVGQLRNHMNDFPVTIERTLVQAIVKRWAGLLSTEIEELRGQAELVVSLKTRRLAPIGQTDVVVEIVNNGRAAAENILVILDENPAYTIHSDPRVLSVLPSGRTWQVSFSLEPRVADRFRLSLTITYDDRNKRDHLLAFGDMVHLLLPARTFNTIPNPYLPGTPLRHDSLLFFGREELFQFIAENAGRVVQHNVLILIGQRRTGKTSLLLRLRQHLPENLLPVYIDCQSLGVMPGMPALLYDLAWQIADALATRQIKVAVPELTVWHEEPTVLFQRRFLPQVRALLPPGTTLVLVFDEFEAFENLVNDGILPPTFFTYMRHLMQHSEGLSFIFVGTRRLEEMSADYWSVLFNIALYQKIGFLNETAVTHLITEPVLPNLVYDDLAIAKIQRVTAGHPYFLQLVCYTLVKQANARRASYVTISDVNAALEEMIRLGEVHFAYLWQRSTFAERATLTAVAHLMDTKSLFFMEELIHYLESYGLDISPTDMTVALNSLVEREIMAEVSEGITTQYELKIGLVGLWVAQNKSLSKLHAEKGKLLVVSG
jgi:outer membrane protein assembly factor BamB